MLTSPRLPGIRLTWRITIETRPRSIDDGRGILREISSIEHCRHSKYGLWALMYRELIDPGHFSDVNVRNYAVFKGLNLSVVVSNCRYILGASMKGNVLRTQSIQRAHINTVVFTPMSSIISHESSIILQVFSFVHAKRQTTRSLQESYVSETSGTSWWVTESGTSLATIGFAGSFPMELTKLRERRTFPFQNCWVLINLIAQARFLPPKSNSAIKYAIW